MARIDAGGLSLQTAAIPHGHGGAENGRKAHTGFEPVLPPNAGGKPNSGSAGEIAPGSELNPHLRAVLERLKERDRERGR
jgi:hypothetical protein